MKQWELRGRTTGMATVVVDAPLVAPAPPVHRAVWTDERRSTNRFPALLWTTDVCLGFTSAGVQDVLSIDIPLDPSDGDLFDLFTSDDGGIAVVEAHLAAVRGNVATFRLRDRGRILHCVVVPFPDPKHRTIGTICIALELVAPDAEPTVLPRIEVA
jgi:hypothetical protein